MNVKTLKSVPLFESIPEKELAVLCERARVLKYAKRSVLIECGDRHVPIHILLAGRVKVYRTSPSGLDAVFAVRGAGECLGELSALDGKPASATVEALTDIEAVQITREAMREAMAENPSLAWALLNVLSQRLREASDTIESLVTKSLSQRLATVLISVGEQYGSPMLSFQDPLDRHPIKLPTPFTTTDLAALVGNSREQVSKALSSLRAQSLVRRDPYDRGIIVRDPDRLRSYASGE
jgi:CRP-like cAMP-binding protein